MTGEKPAPRVGIGKQLMELVGPFLGLLIVLALVTILKPELFWSAINLRTVATQTVMVGLGAIGMTLIIVSGGIDLSAGSVIALSSVVTALVLRDSGSTLLALLSGIATGGALGMFNGSLVAGVRVPFVRFRLGRLLQLLAELAGGLPPFIVTLGTMGIARGLAKYLADEQKVDAPISWLSELMMKSPSIPWLVVAPGVWVMAILAVVAALVLRRTVFGVHVVATGSNEATARLCGIRVARVKVSVYTLSGLLMGLAGVMQFCRLNVGDPTTAVGKELDIIAAVVIGGASLSGGRGTILGAMIGAFMMAILANGCALMSVPNYIQEILVGAIIVVAAAVDRFRGHAQRT